MRKVFGDAQDLTDFLDAVPVKQVAARIEEDRWGYSRSYNRLLVAAQRICATRDVTAFTGVAYLAYSWMPTALKNFDLNSVLDVKQLLNSALDAEGVSGLEATLELVGDAPVNSSWVGTSKALHLLNPRAFPIWDQHVALYWGWKYRSQYNRKDRYAQYAWAIFDNVNHPRIKDLQGVVKSLHGYVPTPVRAIELALFEMAETRRKSA